jgi:hypothetical protein
VNNREYFSNGLPMPVAIRATMSRASDCTALLVSVTLALRTCPISPGKIYQVPVTTIWVYHLPIVGFKRLLPPCSRIAWRASSASFFVFQASFLASAKIVVPLSRESISTRGNRSSRGSIPVPTLESWAKLPTLARSVENLTGSGAEWPSTLSNSLWIVLRSWGFKSSMRDLMAKVVL